jgi:hypothetical protein
LRYGQTIRLRPSLNQKPPAFRRDRGNRRQFTFEAVLFRQEHDPSVRQDHTAGEGVCDVIIDRLTGPAAGTDRHALRNANADPAAATGPADGLLLRDITPRRREEVSLFAVVQDHRDRRQNREFPRLYLLKVLVGHIRFIPVFLFCLLPCACLRTTPEAQNRQDKEDRRDPPFNPCFVLRRRRGRHKRGHTSQNQSQNTANFPAHFSILPFGIMVHANNIIP